MRPNVITFQSRRDRPRRSFEVAVHARTPGDADRCPRAANQVTAPRGLVQFWDDARAVPGDVQACLVAHALEATGEAERIFYVNNNTIITGPGHPVIAGALKQAT